MPEMSPDTARYLRYGRGVALVRMREELRFAPALSTQEAIERVALESLKAAA
jgi:hypothetical protein